MQHTVHALIAANHSKGLPARSIAPIDASMTLILPGGAKRRSYAAEPYRLTKRIGSIVYEVEIHFNPDAREGLDDKRIRLIRRELETAS